MKISFTVFVVLMLWFAPAIVKAQYPDDDASTAIKKSDNWQTGYIVLKDKTDTLKGYLELKESSFGYVDGIWFRKNKEVKKGTLKVGGNLEPKSNIRFFGVADKRYKYFNYTDDSIPVEHFPQKKNSLNGWVEIIGEGPINIYRGVSVTENKGALVVPTVGMVAPKIYYTHMYCLKKGNKPTVLIAAPSISYFKGENMMLYELDERNKNHLVHLLSDYFLLAQRVKNSKVLFGDIEKYIAAYNSWAKENEK